MTRSEYLSELDSHLISLPREERNMAVKFYEEYFDEAGPENEQAVIADLGKPFNLARSIIGETSLYSQSMVYLKYKESKPMPQNNTSVFASLRKPDAFEEAAPNTVDEDIMPNSSPQNTMNTEQDVFPNATQENQTGMFDEHYIKDTPPQPDAAPKQSSNTALTVILIVIGLIFGFPLIIALAAVIFAIFVVMFVFGFVSAVCFIAAIIALVTGIIQLPASVPNAIGFICAALLSAGVGMVMLSASLAFFFKLVPFTFKGIRNLFRKRRAE